MNETLTPEDRMTLRYMHTYSVSRTQKKAATELFEFLEHGSELHRQWLWDAIKAFWDGEPKPEPYE